jgi:hypothetical protein
MRADFAQRKIAWAELTSQDLSDILVYVRGLPGTLHQPDLLLLTSSENGEALFTSKGCATCHRNQLSLRSRLRGQTLTDVAVDMWNHAPKMPKEAPSLNEEEMRDLTSFSKILVTRQPANVFSRRSIVLPAMKMLRAAHLNSRAAARRRSPGLQWSPHCGATVHE